MTAGGKERPLPPALRRERMLAEIKEREFVRVAELSSRFGVSEMTVRGDLDSLAAKGKVHRVRGGAIPRLIARQEQPFEDSISSFAAEKVAIGQAAAALLEDGETVLVDVGTTAAAAARAIAARTELGDVVVFHERAQDRARARAGVAEGHRGRARRNAATAPTFARRPDGDADRRADLPVKTVLLGCNGVDALGGVTNINLPEAEVKKRMLAVAARRIVLADGSKLGRVEVARLCDVGDVDMVLTGRSADQAAVDALRDRGCDVRVVG